MKLVTYNVNGLRPRVSQFGSLRKLLDSLGADVICFQETKLARQEMSTDLVQAEGYESFFSCTRTSDKGRTGYSGVATFCRVKSAFSSGEVALPISAEEGFTGVLKISSGFGKSEHPSTIEGLEDFSTDHVPVYTSLMEIPNVQQHNTPSLSTRYCPQVYGCQRTLVSMFARRQPEEISLSGGSSSIPDDSVVVQVCSQLVKRPQHACNSSSSDLIHEGVFCTSDDCFEGSYKESSSDSPCSEIGHTKSFSSVVYKKKARQSQWSQLSLKSFFQKTVGDSGDSNSVYSDKELTQADISIPCCESNETPTEGGEQDAAKEWQSKQSTSMQEDDTSQPSEKDKNNVALVEWQRIQQLMQTSIPLCKGHKEPCVSRVVKKSGPNLGHRFYVCARAEGPASNPEANCGFFKWATAKSKNKR